MIIIDGMALIQGINVSNLKKYNDLAKLYASVLMQQFIVADTIIEVFDRYNIYFSVKACRAGPDSHTIVYNGSRPIPPWEKLLNVSENKENLIHYICQCRTATCE